MTGADIKTRAKAAPPANEAPHVIVAMNVVYAAASYPAGALSDRGSRIAPTRSHCRPWGGAGTPTTSRACPAASRC